jgi:hypothetical protein
MAQSGTGWQLLRRSPSPIPKSRNDLRPPRETGWYTHRGLLRQVAHDAHICGVGQEEVPVPRPLPPRAAGEGVPQLETPPAPLARPLPPGAAGEGVPQLETPPAPLARPLSELSAGIERERRWRAGISSRTPSPAAPGGRGRGRQAWVRRVSSRTPSPAAPGGRGRLLQFRLRPQKILNGVGCRPAPGASGRSSHALRFSGSARSPTSAASTGTLTGAGNYPLMHPILLRRLHEGAEECRFAARAFFGTFVQPSPAASIPCDHSLRPPQPPEQKEPARPAFGEPIPNPNTRVQNARPVVLGD